MSEPPLRHLPRPLESLLDDPVEEHAVHRIWKGSRKRQRQRDRRRERLGVAVVGAVILAAVGWFFAASPNTGELRLGDGSLPSATDGTGQELRLSDGSNVRLAPGARWIPLRNQAEAFESELVRGRVRFSVRPGGPRKWTIRSGAVTVSVVGTRFQVERRGPEVGVAVERGMVEVDHPALESPSILRAGDSLWLPASSERGDPPEAQNDFGSGGEGSSSGAETVGREDARDLEDDSDRGASTEISSAETQSEETQSAETQSMETPSADTSSTSASSDEPSVGTLRDSTASGAASIRSSWRALAADGDHRGAYDSLGPVGLREHSERASAEQLMVLADIARLSGRPHEAVPLLERVLDEHPSSPRAPMAAVVLGRLEMDLLRRPARARRAFERALDLGVAPPLRSDVEARLRRLASTP